MRNNPIYQICRKSIALTLGLYILVIGIIVTILSASLQLYIEYAHDRKDIDDNITEIHNSMEGPITESLWITNDELLSNLIHGLLTTPNIEKVELQKQDGTLLAKGKISAENILIHEHELTKLYRGKTVKLGHIKISANLDIVWDKLIDRSLIIIGTQAIWSILLALSAVGLFYWVVGRHLVNMSAYSKSLSIDSLDVPLKLNKRIAFDSNNNEVDSLSNAINDMREKLRSSLESLRDRDEKYRAVVDNVGDYIMRYDKAHRHIYANRLALETTGLPIEEYIGKTHREMGFPEHLCDMWEKSIQNVFESGNQQRIEFDVELAEGLMSLDLLLTPEFASDGSIKSVIGISRDVTERKQIQKEKEQMEQSLAQIQKIESIGTLAGGIAHDFNNILFPIVGMSELLMEDLPNDSPEYENALEIYEAGKRGAELVKQILSFSRQHEHKLIPVKIQKVISEAIKLARSTVPRSIDIQYNIQNDPGMVMADSTQIHQITMNLITNAYHAVEVTDGVIDIQLQRIKLSENEIQTSSLIPGDYMKLSVSDNGVGMDKNTMNKIFEPYFTTKEKGKGTGLGLSVVLGIIKEHNGDIKVYSEKGKGTTFNVYLPLIKKRYHEKKAIERTTFQTGTEKILLIDDEKSVVKLESQILSRLGYEVTEQTDSQEALNLFESNPDNFDLIITDMTMPKMTGDRLAKKILFIEPNMPIIICTGFSERIDKEKAEQIGVNGFLMKPIVQLDIAQMVRKVLDDKKNKQGKKE